MSFSDSFENALAIHMFNNAAIADPGEGGTGDTSDGPYCHEGVGIDIRAEVLP